jgi:hypothetical protein
MTLQQLHERLLSWATASPREPELLRAKGEYFERYGEPHEEDRSYEVRLNAMLDHYLEAEAVALGAEDLDAYRALTQNVHGLFEVGRIKSGQVRLRDVLTGRDHEVTERRHVAGLEKGDLIEARLLPFGGELYFSGAFLYHPREARKAILGEVKRMKKGAPKGTAPNPETFLARLSRMALKMERYRNVRLESIYDFSPDARTFTPRPPPREREDA